VELKQALEQMLESVRKSLKENLDASEKDTLPDSTKPIDLQGSKPVEFDFYVDGSGNYHAESSGYGAGKTVDCIAWITDPGATYTITIKSSTGGGGHWENVTVNQKISFKIETSFWHKTKVTVDGHCTAAGQKGNGMLQYSY
jgi:hypothetical protein